MAKVEKEAKLTVSLQDYDRVKAAGRVLSCRDQLNVYLHDPSRLHEGLGYLRVRYEAGREPVATLKVPKGWDGEVREMMEVEVPLREFGPGLFPWPRRLVGLEDLSGEMAEHFLAHRILRLRRLGWMRNLRCVVELGALGSVELDRTQLPGGEIHHEVEVETQDDGALRVLVARIREIAPSAEPSRVGKFSLFLEAVGDIR